jgi:predicted nucleotidyltransferase
VSDPKEIIAALSDEGARFIIVGGVAMVIHGSAYVTEDLDIVYARSDDNLAAIVRAVKPFRPRLRVSGEPDGVPFLFDASTLHAGMNFTLTTDKGDLDLLGEISGIGRYEDAMESSETIALFGRSYDVLSLAGLIRAKRAAGRPKDLQAVPELEHLLEIQTIRKTES